MDIQSLASESTLDFNFLGDNFDNCKSDQTDAGNHGNSEQQQEQHSPTSSAMMDCNIADLLHSDSAEFGDFGLSLSDGDDFEEFFGTGSAKKCEVDDNVISLWGKVGRDQNRSLVELKPLGDIPEPTFNEINTVNFEGVEEELDSHEEMMFHEDQVEEAMLIQQEEEDDDDAIQEGKLKHQSYMDLITISPDALIDRPSEETKDIAAPSTTTSVKARGRGGRKKVAPKIEVIIPDNAKINKRGRPKSSTKTSRKKNRSKKTKLWQNPDLEDPKVKRAFNAKLNRDKHKKEKEDLEAQIEQHKKNEMELEAQIENLKEQNDILLKGLEEESRARKVAENAVITAGPSNTMTALGGAVFNVLKEHLIIPIQIIQAQQQDPAPAVLTAINHN
jgi:hypothetical protein